MNPNFNLPNDDNFQLYYKFLQSNPQLVSQNHQLPTQSSQNHSNSSSQFNLSQIQEPQHCSQIPSNILNSSNFSHNTMNYDENETGENDEVVEIGSSGKQSVGKRSGEKNTWVNAEDEALISSFMLHSEDFSIGTSQKKRDLWVRVKTLFDEAKQTNDQLRERSAGMLNNRFRRIAAGVMKFVGCYEEATRNKTSGMTEEDVISNARTIHQSSFGHCKFEHCWYLLRQYRKWDDTVTCVLPDVFKNVENYRGTPTIQTDPKTSSSGKRSFDQTTPSVDGEGTSSQRPMGIKASKKIKGKAKVDDDSHTENLAKSMAIFTEVARDKVNIAKRKEERKLKQMEIDLRRLDVDEKNANMNMKSNLLQTLLAKPQLTPREEQLVNKLLTDLGMD